MQHRITMFVSNIEILTTIYLFYIGGWDNVEGGLHGTLATLYSKGGLQDMADFVMKSAP